MAAIFLIFSVLVGHVCADMSQAAYVWQRSWSPRVELAIKTQAEQIDGLTVLCAEVMRGYQDKPTWINVLPNWELLKQSELPINLAIRAGEYSDSFEADQPMTQCLLGEVRKALASVRAAGLEPAAVEIDFDCATRNLEGYAEWLRLIREELGGVPLSITTLPTWMSRPEAFADLIAEVDHFVLQVHSVQRAHTIDSDALLCDPQLAQHWTLQAARFGKPYHVALPTYAYRLGYDDSGKLVEVAGENASPMQNPDWRYRVIRAEPDAMSSLVRTFRVDRPANCLGVIWYRLPIGQELHNWDPQTWRAVMAGRVGGDTWQAHARTSSGGVVEIELIQNSEIAAEPPEQILVSWGEGTALAWDGQRQYSVITSPDHGLIWQWPSTISPPLLRNGTRWTIGWLRMESAAELNISIIHNDD